MQKYSFLAISETKKSKMYVMAMTSLHVCDSGPTEIHHLVLNNTTKHSFLCSNVIRPMLVIHLLSKSNFSELSAVTLCHVVFVFKFVDVRFITMCSLRSVGQLD